MSQFFGTIQQHTTTTCTYTTVGTATLTLPAGVQQLCYLVVAGGGGGGYRSSTGAGGGGGAGGVCTGMTWTPTSGSYTITVGAGGTSGAATPTNGNPSCIVGTSVTVSTLGGGRGSSNGGAAGSLWYNPATKEICYN